MQHRHHTRARALQVLDVARGNVRARGREAERIHPLSYWEREREKSSGKNAYLISMCRSVREREREKLEELFGALCSLFRRSHSNLRYVCVCA